MKIDLILLALNSIKLWLINLFINVFFYICMREEIYHMFFTQYNLDFKLYICVHSYI